MLSEGVGRGRFGLKGAILDVNRGPLPSLNPPLIIASGWIGFVLLGKFIATRRPYLGRLVSTAHRTQQGRLIREMVAVPLQRN